METRRSYRWLPPAVGLLVAIGVGACSEGSSPAEPNSAEPAGTSQSESSSINATAEFCQTITFDDQIPAFTHHDAITSVFVDFGSGVTRTFNVTTVAPTPAGWSARAFDVDIPNGDCASAPAVHRSDRDLDQRAAPAGSCPGCADDGIVLAFQLDNATDACNSGVQDGDRAVTFTLPGAEQFRLTDFEALDHDWGGAGESAPTWSRDGTVVATSPTPIQTPPSDDGNFSIVPTDYGAEWRWDRNDSGAIDDLRVCVMEDIGGGEGCTPGYWKQSQHFDSWTPPYTPSTLFCDVFECAFPGMTLLDVLKQGGGGLKALGRHTVAALLNAASPGVSYDLSAGQVISDFNAVYPGSKSDYNAQKDIFEGFNEQGCPLN